MSQEKEQERVVFTHEIQPSHSIRLIVSGPVDDQLVDILEAYIKFQKTVPVKSYPNEPGESHE